MTGAVVYFGSNHFLPKSDIDHPSFRAISDRRKTSKKPAYQIFSWLVVQISYSLRISYLLLWLLWNRIPPPASLNPLTVWIITNWSGCRQSKVGMFRSSVGHSHQKKEKGRSKESTITIPVSIWRNPWIPKHIRTNRHPFPHSHPRYKNPQQNWIRVHVVMWSILMCELFAFVPPGSDQKFRRVCPSPGEEEVHEYYR